MGQTTPARGRAAFSAALFLSALGGCASVQSSGADAAICASDAVRVYADFPAAGRHDCVIAPDGTIIVTVDHEPSVEDGINPSPWFALRLDAQAAGRHTLVLDYPGYDHRYSPETSTDRTSWRALDAARIALSEDETRATLTLDLAAGDNWLAGQPIVSSREQVEWTRARLAPAGFREVEYGRSLQDRPLIGFIGGNLDAPDVYVALTRQHPPETTGQDAFRGLVARLVDRDDAAIASFLSRHKILLAPMANPDGVDGGHWRLNRGGIDLNRDWGPFTQPETRAITDWIVRESEGRRVVAFMDFHSTNRDVMYAPPLDAPSPTIAFLPFLEQRFNETLAAPPEWSYAHNENSGTSKGWALDVLKAPGVTVELWDETPQADAERIGSVIADALAAYFAD